MTPNGDVFIDATVFHLGNGSAKFDGTADSISTPASADFAFDFGGHIQDFTFDFWVRFDGSLDWTAVDNYFYSYNKGADANSCFLINGADTLSVVLQGSTYNFGWTPSGDVWYHVAVVADASSPRNLKVFIDGDQIGVTQSSSDVITCGNPFIVGAGFSDTSPLNGWIDEFRVSRIARWSGHFTPNTAEYS